MRSEGYSTWSVCVGLSVSSYSRTTGFEAAHDYPETTAFERYAVKTSEKANMHNRTSLPRPIRLLFVPCGGTRSHHEGHSALARYLIV